MKSKIISRAVALLVVGAAAASMANTPSVASKNIVGVLRIELQPGLSLVSTPLLRVGVGALQTLNDVFGTQLPDLSEVHLFDPGMGYVTYTYFGGDWYDSGMQPGAGSTEIERGDGFWVKNPTGEPLTLSVTGEVPEAEQEHVELPLGLRLVSYSFPVDTSSIDWIGLVPDDLDEIHLFDPGMGYVTYTYFGGDWYDSSMAPSVIDIAPGSAFWYDSQAGKWWSQSRTYTLD